MAMREFKDSEGAEWRAWDVFPDKLDPRTRDEDYLAQLYITGWIVFETASGSDKRRLYPIPRGWQELPDTELEVLLRKAEVVPQRKLESEQEASGPAATRAVERAARLAEQLIDRPDESREIIRDETPDVTDLSAVRAFRYPGGRVWTTCVVSRTADHGASVLRFSSGSRYIDLADWPKDWVDRPDAALVDLLREAAPRETHDAPPAGTPGRRWDDRPTA